MFSLTDGQVFWLVWCVVVSVAGPVALVVAWARAGRRALLEERARLQVIRRRLAAERAGRQAVAR